MDRTGIRWTDATWNPMSGCTVISPGCDNCYAMTLAENRRGTPAFPVGFDTVFKPKKLADPATWLRRRGPLRIFTNSMSDVFHEDFTDDQIDQVFRAMVATPEHDYLMLTKRPQRLADYLLGWRAPSDHRRAAVAAGRTLVPNERGWLSRFGTGLDQVPANIWLGVSIENDKYTWRADWLRLLPVPVRFLSIEPLLGPVPSLNLDRIQWAIVGGESGPGWRPMDHEWARHVRDLAATTGTAFYFKQSAAYRTELGLELDDERHEWFPLPHPSTPVAMDHRAAGRLDHLVGRYLDADLVAAAEATPVKIR